MKNKIVSKSIKVLYVPSDNYANSGAFLQMVDMIREHKKMGVNPLVVLPNKKGTGKELLVKENIPHVVIRSIDWLINKDANGKSCRKKILKIIKRNIVAIVRFIRLINKYDIDIIHINTIWTFVGAIAALLTNKKCIWHVREAIDLAFSFKIIFSWGYKLINKVDKIISVSKAVLDTYPEIDKSKAVVVYDGINNKKIVERKKPLFVNKVVQMVCVGEIYKQKGQYDLIKACSMLIDNNIKNWHLTFIGGGEIKQVKDEISKLGMTSFIDVIGPKNNVNDYLATMDIGFTPSWFEGFGRVAAEVSMSGCLLICSDGGAFTELYKHKKTAIFHKSQSSESIFEAIKWVFENKEDAIQIAKKGKVEALNKYTSFINAANIYKIYDNIMLNIK